MHEKEPEHTNLFLNKILNEDNLLLDDIYSTISLNEIYSTIVLDEIYSLKEEGVTEVAESSAPIISNQPTITPSNNKPSLEYRSYSPLQMGVEIKPINFAVNPTMLVWLEEAQKLLRSTLCMPTIAYHKFIELANKVIQVCSEKKDYVPSLILRDLYITQLYRNTSCYRKANESGEHSIEKIVKDILAMKLSLTNHTEVISKIYGDKNIEQIKNIISIRVLVVIAKRFGLQDINLLKNIVYINDIPKPLPDTEQINVGVGCISWSDSEPLIAMKTYTNSLVGLKLQGKKSIALMCIEPYHSVEAIIRGMKQYIQIFSRMKYKKLDVIILGENTNIDKALLQCAKSNNKINDIKIASKKVTSSYGIYKIAINMRDFIWQSLEGIEGTGKYYMSFQLFSAAKEVIVQRKAINAKVIQNPIFCSKDIVANIFCSDLVILHILANSPVCEMVYYYYYDDTRYLRAAYKKQLEANQDLLHKMVQSSLENSMNKLPQAHEKRAIIFKNIEMMICQLKDKLKESVFLSDNNEMNKKGVEVLLNAAHITIWDDLSVKYSVNEDQWNNFIEKIERNITDLSKLDFSESKKRKLNQKN